MQRMLERHMDDETKLSMLKKIDTIECSGLTYQQHGVTYQNAHYDMSFILKNLREDEFNQLKKLVGQTSPKIQQANDSNYKTISFTATEYEALKKSLEQHQPKNMYSFFCPPPAKALSKKLQFEFNSLITALNNYINSDGDDESYLKIGKAQRDVPAHLAHEYCRKDRSFDQSTSFNEESLLRDLSFQNNFTDDRVWFPLSSSSGLGFDFALMHSLGYPYRGMLMANMYDGSENLINSKSDLAALRKLEETRTLDLTQSRDNLSQSLTLESSRPHAP